MSGATKQWYIGTVIFTVMATLFSLRVGQGIPWPLYSLTVTALLLPLAFPPDYE